MSWAQRSASPQPQHLAPCFSLPHAHKSRTRVECCMHAACTLQEKSEDLAFNCLCMHYRLLPYVTQTQLVGTAKYVYWNIASAITQSHKHTRASSFGHVRGQRPLCPLLFHVCMPPTFHAPRRQAPSAHHSRFCFIPFAPRVVTIRGKNATPPSRSKPLGCDFE